MLNHEIELRGFDNVMASLNGKGIEIDNALEILLYKYNDEGAAMNALLQLAEIIKGHALDKNEAREISDLGDLSTENSEALYDIPIR